MIREEFGVGRSLVVQLVRRGCRFASQSFVLFLGHIQLLVDVIPFPSPDQGTQLRFVRRTPSRTHNILVLLLVLLSNDS